jgi:hypothetical protein
MSRPDSPRDSSDFLPSSFAELSFDPEYKNAVGKIAASTVVWMFLAAVFAVASDILQPLLPRNTIRPIAAVVLPIFYLVGCARILGKEAALRKDRLEDAKAKSVILAGDVPEIAVTKYALEASVCSSNLCAEGLLTNVLPDDATEKDLIEVLNYACLATKTIDKKFVDTEEKRREFSDVKDLFTRGIPTFADSPTIKNQSLLQIILIASTLRKLHSLQHPTDGSEAKFASINLESLNEKFVNFCEKLQFEGSSEDAVEQESQNFRDKFFLPVLAFVGYGSIELDRVEEVRKALASSGVRAVEHEQLAAVARRRDGGGR